MIWDAADLLETRVAAMRDLPWPIRVGRVQTHKRREKWMKSIRDRLTEQNKGEVRTQNRPDIRDDRPKGVLFSTEGSTGWNHIRNIHYHKGNKSEKNFDHLNEKFWGEGDDPV